MIINITKTQSVSRRYKFMADCPELPGIPPIGYGDTKAHAIDNLFCRLFFSYYTWEKHLDFSEIKKNYIDNSIK